MGNCYITSTASFQISCGDDQSHNYNKCVIVKAQKPDCRSVLLLIVAKKNILTTPKALQNHTDQQLPTTEYNPTIPQSC